MNHSGHDLTTCILRLTTLYQQCFVYGVQEINVFQLNFTHKIPVPVYTSRVSLAASEISSSSLLANYTTGVHDKK